MKVSGVTSLAVCTLGLIGYSVFLYIKPFLEYKQTKNIALPSPSPQGKTASAEVTPQDKIASHDKKKEEQGVVQALPISKLSKKQHLSLNQFAHDFTKFAGSYQQKKKEEQELSIIEIRFLEKIIQSIATMCKIYNHKLLPYMYDSYKVQCAISLKNNGLIEHVAISKTSGNIMLDSLLQTIIQEAGTSFPPLPQQLNKKQYIFIVQFTFDRDIALQILLPR